MGLLVAYNSIQVYPCKYGVRCGVTGSYGRKRNICALRTAQNMSQLSLMSEGAPCNDHFLCYYCPADFVVSFAGAEKLVRY